MSNIYCISSRKLESNRKNSSLGGAVIKMRAQNRYASDPKYCRNCKDLIPYEKRLNQFCSRNCAATHNNKIAPKRKSSKVLGTCKWCSGQTYNKMFCSTSCASSKYTTDEERKIAVKKRTREVSANYRAKLREQTPIEADRKKIREFYDNCPAGYEVDHIIPISRGGLHILENLQYLTISENRRKSNKL